MPTVAESIKTSFESFNSSFSEAKVQAAINLALSTNRIGDDLVTYELMTLLKEDPENMEKLFTTIRTLVKTANKPEDNLYRESPIEPI